MAHNNKRTLQPPEELMKKPRVKRRNITPVRSASQGRLVILEPRTRADALAFPGLLFPVKGVTSSSSQTPTPTPPSNPATPHLHPNHHPHNHYYTPSPSTPACGTHHLIPNDQLTHIATLMTSLSEENNSIRSELQLLHQQYTEVQRECKEVKRTMDAVTALGMLGEEVVFEGEGKGKEGGGSRDLRSEFAAVAPTQQRKFLADELSRKIRVLKPEFPRKISGMIIEGEKDNVVLINLLEDESALRAKVDEAFDVWAAEMNNGKGLKRGCTAGKQ